MTVSTYAGVPAAIVALTKEYSVSLAFWSLTNLLAANGIGPNPASLLSPDLSVISDTSGGLRLPLKPEATANTKISATPAPQSGPTPVFTDNPLTAGVTIKAVHVTELRDAVNQARSLAGLSAASWAESVTSGVMIKAAHIVELRARLDQARAALGLSAAIYTDPSLSAGTTVKAPHLQELRQRVREALAPSGVEQLVAVHVSENTDQNWSYTAWRYFHTYQFLEEALKSDGTPYEEVSDSSIESGGLLNGTGAPRYPILISLAAECISDTAATKIRDYVNAGGYVYVGGSAWTKFSDGQSRRQNGKPVFALSSEMGLTGGGWVLIDSLIKTGESSMIDHLPTPLNNGNPWMWWMPRSYNFSAGEGTQVAFDRHWVWSARPTETAPASVLLSPVQPAGFSTSTPWAAWSSAYDVHFADVNGDGKTDIIGRDSQTGDVQVGISNGTGFLSSTSWASWSPAYDIHFADANGDGKADILGRNLQTGDVQVGISTGSGFNTPTSWATWSLGNDIHFADANGDGKADILGRNSQTSVVEVGISTGSGFNTPTPWGIWNSAYSIDFADANGDGKADIVGRNSQTADVQVGISSGIAFTNSTSWATWGLGYDIHFADVNGDGKADIAGRNLQTGDVQVGISTGSGFNPSTSWGFWGLGFDIDFADANGDGKADILGRATAVEVAISTGTVSTPVNQPSGISELAQKTYGAGKFIYNAEFVPLAGYGGHASVNSGYKTIRTAINDAFRARLIPLVRLSTWPYPSRAAFIYRHDHLLSIPVVNIECKCGSPPETGNWSPVRGEYYIWPAYSGSSPPGCPPLPEPEPPPNDYPSRVSEAVAKGAIIGAHVIRHSGLDPYSYDEASCLLNKTIQLIHDDTGITPRVFVAPNYLALRKSSIQAIWDAGFLTTGEQRIGPMPHFSIDPEIRGAYIGTLLQLPTSEWLGPYVDGTKFMFDSLDSMLAFGTWPDTMKSAVDLSYASGGLINLYDHILPTDKTKDVLNYVFEPTKHQNVWNTNSLEIRDWWLQRFRRIITSSFQSIDAGHVEINIAVQINNPLAQTSYPETNVGLRILLDDQSLQLANQGVVATINGEAPTEALLANNELFVRFGTATSVKVRLGQP